MSSMTIGTSDVCPVFDATPDELIQVTFTVARSVRRLAFHDPLSLSARDFYFRYSFCRDVRPGSDGMTLAQKFEAGTRHLSYLEPGEQATVELDLSGSMVAVRDALHAASAVYLIGGDADGPHVLNLAIANGRIADPDQPLAPLAIDVPTGRFEFPASGRVADGPVTATVENAMTERSSVWVVEYPKQTGPPQPVPFGPLLTAKRLLSNQTFRSLFRSETVAASESLEVRDLTFLFTDLQGSTAMYDRIGDATAYNLVRLHFDALEATVREHDGAIVKTIGDAIMATFLRPADGVATALAMFERLAEFNRGASASLVLKVGLHRGHAMAVTLNGRLDYFGQAVNIAARVQGLAAAGEVVLSEGVFEDAAVRRLLADREPRRESGLLRGVSDEVGVYRVRP
jgi:class 3 adenylate cyclase